MVLPLLDISGQPAVLGHLQRVLAGDRMASTWIFAGPEGVGKFTTATALAAVKLCEHPKQSSNTDGPRVRLPGLDPRFSLLEACGQCASCRAIHAGSHPDLHLVHRRLVRLYDKSGKSKATTLSIQVIRSEITGDASPDNRVESKLYTRSKLGRGKWFIIDEADLMQVEAQNALLKALEEPPPGTYLVLISASPSDLLSTIRSRAQIVQFQSLPLDAIGRALMARGLTETQARQLARISNGSLGRAMQWLSATSDEAQANDEKPASAKSRSKKSANSPAEPDATGEPPPVFNWINQICTMMDKIAQQQAGGMNMADLLARCADQFAGIGLKRDSLASRDRLVRDGVMTMLGIIGEWLDDQLRLATGTKPTAPLPTRLTGLPTEMIQHCLEICQTAQRQVDQNAHVNLLLASTGTAIEGALRAH